MKILLIGSFAGGNFGDTLVLNSIVRLFESSFDGPVEFYIPTADPEFINGLFEKENVIPLDINMRRTFSFRFLSFNILKKIKEIDCAITTAGIFFDFNLFDPRKNFIFSLLPILKILKDRGGQIFSVNVGVTSPTSKIGKVFLKKIINYHDIFITRDDYSQKVVQGLDVRIPFYKHADIAHTYIPKKNITSSDSSYLPTNTDNIGINLSDHLDSHVIHDKKMSVSKKEYINLVVRQIEQIAMEGDYNISFFATTKKDHLLHKEVAEQLSISEFHLYNLANMSMNEGIHIIRKFDIVISTRMHACLIATSLAKPTLAISYHPKVRSYMNEINCNEWVISVKKSITDLLTEKFVMLLSNKEEVGGELANQANYRRKTALAGFNRVRKKILATKFD